MALITKIGPGDTLSINGVRITVDHQVRIYVHDEADIHCTGQTGETKRLGRELSLTAAKALRTRAETFLGRARYRVNCGLAGAVIDDQLSGVHRTIQFGIGAEKDC